MKAFTDAGNLSGHARRKYLLRGQPCTGLFSQTFQGMMRNRLVDSAASLAYAAVVGVASVQGETVYQNVNVINQTVALSGSAAGKEYGDEITLAGVNRFVDKFTIAYFAEIANSPKAAAVLTIYKKDGSLANPSSSSSQRPGGVIWQSDPFSLADGVHGLDITPNVFVPDTIIWTIKFTGLTAGSPDVAGIMMADTPTIGGLLPGRLHPVIGSYEDFWVKYDPANDDSWALKSFGTTSSPLGNFYLDIDAVPEPSTIALSVLSGAIIWSWAKKRRA